MKKVTVVIEYDEDAGRNDLVNGIQVSANYVFTYGGV